MPCVVQVAAEKQRQHLGGIHALAVGLGEIAGTIIVHDAGHSARLIERCRRPLRIV